MDKMYICRRVPHAHNDYLEMLIYQQLEGGIEAVVGSVKFSYDEDVTDVEINYGDGRIFYRSMDFFMRSDWCEFAVDHMDGSPIMEYRPRESPWRQQYLQWQGELYPVHCEHSKDGPGAVTVTIPDLTARNTRFLQIQPQARGRELSWTVEIPDRYPMEMRMVLVTLPLSFNSENFMYAPWLWE